MSSGATTMSTTLAQINILALVPPICPRAHDPGRGWQRLSKRHGAVSVMQYAEEGYLPEALLNYLARLAGLTMPRCPVCSSWYGSIFHHQQIPARFNRKPLHEPAIPKAADNEWLAPEALPGKGRVRDRGRAGAFRGVNLLKERVNTVPNLRMPRRTSTGL